MLQTTLSCNILNVYCVKILVFQFIQANHAKNIKSSYKELLVIRNLFSFPNLQQGTSSLYMFICRFYCLVLTSAPHTKTSLVTRYKTCFYNEVQTIQQRRLTVEFLSLRGGLDGRLARLQTAQGTLLQVPAELAGSTRSTRSTRAKLTVWVSTTGFFYSETPLMRPPFVLRKMV